MIDEGKSTAELDGTGSHRADGGRADGGRADGGRADSRRADSHGRVLAGGDAEAAGRGHSAPTGASAASARPGEEARAGSSRPAAPPSEPQPSEPQPSEPQPSEPQPSASPEPGAARPKRPGRPKKKKTGPGSHPNNVRQLRVERMMSKAELARRAGLSVLTVDRVEKGHGCRMDTKRKILQALELSLGDRVRVFGETE